MRIFKQFLDQNSIVCCSGGVDSIAIAHFLQRKYGIHELYHFNHGTPQAHLFQMVVEQFAKDFNFNLTIRTTNVKLEKEADFRNARFEYIKSQENKTFVTGHNLDEATESHILNFLRGQDNFLPIPIYSEFGTNKVLHPFLMIEKQVLRHYVKKNDLEKYVIEDHTNYDKDVCRRNWIRNEMLPLINGQKIGLKTIVLKKYLKRIVDNEK